jgi:hypothetical protein
VDAGNSLEESIMSSKGDMVCGAHQVHTLGDIDLQSLGAAVTIRAGGDEADLVLDGTGTANLSCGPSVLTMTQSGPVQGKIDMMAGAQGTINLWVGLPVIGPQIKMEPEKITLSVGLPGVGSMIEMTPTGITLSVAEITLKITPLGHQLTAAETEHDVLVSGVSVKAPMQQIQIEAANQQSETLATHGTDGIRQQQVGMEMEQ